MNHSTLVVSEQLVHARLDCLLTDAFPSHSRSYFQGLITSGHVLVNGKPSKKRSRLDVGDTISITFTTPPLPSVEPQNIPLEVLYEDDFLIAVNKPPGMVTHPAVGNPHSTFVNALLHHCTTLPMTEQLRPGIVHRLDKDTSGVILAAKDVPTHRSLVALFASRAIEKRYLALCVGDPGSCTIDAPIGRDPKRRQQMHVDAEHGKPATSVVHTIKYREDLSWVDVHPITGRTHQIRVHLRHLGCPIVGDRVYGWASWNAKSRAPRQMLHAYFLGFTHPVTKTPLQLQAPVPGDMALFAPPPLPPLRCE